LKMASDEDIFRFHVIEVKGIDWNNFLGPSIPLDLESVYGTYGGGWDYRYFNQFLGATFSSPAKLWGMLNVKYVVSSQEINDSYYELVEYFDSISEGTISDNSYTHEAYLYENKLVLPRASLIDSSALVIGQKEYANQLMYGLITSDKFNPSKLMILQGDERVNDYKISELMKYDVLFLTQGSIDQNSMSLLEKYKSEGGIILPDVTDGKDSLNAEEFNVAFDNINTISSEFIPVEVLSYYDETPNYMKIQVDNVEDAFLSVSEKYTLYPGWTAKVDGKETEILLANGVLSAVYLPAGAREVEFKYYPNSFKKGLIITLIGWILLLIYFGWPWVSKLKKFKK